MDKYPPINGEEPRTHTENLTFPTPETYHSRAIYSFDKYYAKIKPKIRPTKKTRKENVQWRLSIGKTYSCLLGTIKTFEHVENAIQYLQENQEQIFHENYNK